MEDLLRRGHHAPALLGYALIGPALIVRARQKTRGKDDVTVKFRPGRRSQLTDSWLATTKTAGEDFDSELKVEEDWAASPPVFGHGTLPFLHARSDADARRQVAALAARGDAVRRNLEAAYPQRR